jgi:hypothetical protein
MSFNYGYRIRQDDEVDVDRPAIPKGKMLRGEKIETKKEKPGTNSSSQSITHDPLLIHDSMRGNERRGCKEGDNRKGQEQ